MSYVSAPTLTDSRPITVIKRAETLIQRILRAAWMDILELKDAGDAVWLRAL